MKLDINLQELLGAIDVPADWVGVREVYEAHTPRMIRMGCLYRMVDIPLMV